MSEVDITALLADQNYASIVAHRSLRMILKLIWINSVTCESCLKLQPEVVLLQKHSATSDVGGFERVWGFRKQVLANGCRFG